MGALVDRVPGRQPQPRPERGAGGGALGVTVTSSAASAATTLVVDANQPFRTVTHVASGGLYGLDTASVPADSLVEPLHPNTFVQMAPGGKQLPNGESTPGGDALVVAPEAAAAGAKVVVRMPDWYPNFPYQWVSWSNWLSAVDTRGELSTIARSARHTLVRSALVAVIRQRSGLGMIAKTFRRYDAKKSSRSWCGLLRPRRFPAERAAQGGARWGAPP